MPLDPRTAKGELLYAVSMLAFFGFRFGVRLFPLSRCCGGISDKKRLNAQRNSLTDDEGSGQAEREESQIDLLALWEGETGWHDLILALSSYEANQRRKGAGRTAPKKTAKVTKKLKK